MSTDLYNVHNPYGRFMTDFTGSYGTNSTEYGFFTYELNGEILQGGLFTSGLPNQLLAGDMSVAHQQIIGMGGTPTGYFHNHPGGTGFSVADQAFMQQMFGIYGTGFITGLASGDDFTMYVGGQLQ